MLEVFFLNLEKVGKALLAETESKANEMQLK